MTPASLRKEVIDHLQQDGASWSEDIVLKAYTYQYFTNGIFRTFCNALSKEPNKISQVSDLAYLPISSYKRHLVKSGDWPTEMEFLSSTTTGDKPSRFALKSSNWYEQVIDSLFTSVYGPVSDYCFLALLPSYLERKNSSLVYMVNHLIKASKYPQSQFYKNDVKALSDQVKYVVDHHIPTIIFGVTYALLDFAEEYPMALSDTTTILETGGMKGRRTEKPKAEVHQILKEAFGCPVIHSEYGMTELISQFYSLGDGLFNQSSPYAQVSLVSQYDPFECIPEGRSGRTRITDIANIDTCSFILSDDQGIIHPNGQFEVIGRLEGSELRGCNLMYDNLNYTQND